MTTSPSSAALDHLRVLDLTSYLGQMCARVLGDLGADVIKVEPPGGDPARLLPPFAGEQRDPERSLRFINANRSKRSVVLDMNAPGDRDQIRALAERSDILIEDFAPGHLAGLGLGYQELRQHNPGLVYVSITPFGQTGPYSGFKGGELVAQSSGGVIMADGDDGMRPCMPPYEIASQVACLQAAYGALLAIRARRQTGQGQHVDVSRQETTLSAAFPYISRYTREQLISRREGRHSQSGAVNTFRCADGGYANLSIYMDSHFTRLARDVMHHPILSEEVWLDRDVRRDNREIIDSYVEEYAASVKRDDFVERGQHVGIAIVPLLTVEGFLHHPHAVERGFFKEMEHPVIGRYRTAGPPVQLS
ncbi:MAG: Formyl-CoA transferase, partial [Dehalococcoidia bacterium]|nr:Formyl-CoA transferase [Dehalococcoidia bacterium]